MPAPLLEAATQPREAPVLADLVKGTERLIVRGGLHYIHGNKAPYFSITATLYGPDPRDTAGGCLHDDIEAWFPGHFTDMIALHGSYIDGEPLHALENGWYHLGFTEWQAINRDHAKKYFRISDAELDTLLQHINYPVLGIPSSEIREARLRLNDWVEAQKPRWKAEAEACFARHGRIIFGKDLWRDEK